jgi:hypothetical protein
MHENFSPINFKSPESPQRCFNPSTFFPAVATTKPQGKISHQKQKDRLGVGERSEKSKKNYVERRNKLPLFCSFFHFPLFYPEPFSSSIFSEKKCTVWWVEMGDEVAAG